MVKNDFWLTSGWHLLDQNDEGHLVPNEDFMRAYFYRPEVVPIEESCEAEIDIHKRLVDTPFLNIEKKELDKIKDKDVIFNLWYLFKYSGNKNKISISFRNRSTKSTYSWVEDLKSFNKIYLEYTVYFNKIKFGLPL